MQNHDRGKGEENLSLAHKVVFSHSALAPFPKKLRISPLGFLLATALRIHLVITMHVNKLAIMPIVSVTAKPLTAPVPK